MAYGASLRRQKKHALGASKRIDSFTSSLLQRVHNVRIKDDTEEDFPSFFPCGERVP